MRHHDLKIWPIYFERVRNGTKTFEVRNNDRDFQAGDTVTLKEFDNSLPEHQALTGRCLDFSIGYVLRIDEIAPHPIGCDRVVFSLLPPKDSQ